MGDALPLINPVAQRPPADQRRPIGRDAAFGGVAVAGRAHLRKNLGALRRRAAARRQIGTGRTAISHCLMSLSVSGLPRPASCCAAAALAASAKARTDAARI